jgi:hypothetical protein
VQIASYNIEFPSAMATPYLDRALMYPDHRKTFNQKDSLVVGKQSITMPISVSGKVLEVFYWFKRSAPSTTTTPAVFSFNPNPFSVVTNHQINIAGHSYPLNPNYNSSFTAAGVEVGLSRHYDELLINVNKYNPQRNTFLDYVTWRDSLRIYSILMNDSAVTRATTLNLQILLSQPITVACEFNLAIRYVSEKASS